MSAKVKLLESYNGVLSDEEIIDILIFNCEKKLAKQREVEYWEKVMNPPAPDPVPTDKFYSVIIGKAVSEHQAKKKVFALSAEEKRIYWLLSLYFTNNPQFEKEEEGFSLYKGIYLFGNVGCGKTTLMNLCRSNPKQSYFVISTSKIADEFKKSGVGMIEKYYELLPASMPSAYFDQRELGICFDDLGTEPSGKWMGNESNVMADIFLRRYENEAPTGFKTHLTTNLSGDDIETFYGPRIRSRMREMFNVINFPENSTDKRR